MDEHLIRKLAVGIFLLLVGLAGIVRADDRTTLAVVRVCMSERDTETSTNDCAAITDVLKFRAQIFGSVLQAAQAYSPRATGIRRVTDPSERQSWIQNITLDLREPRGWAEMNVWRVEHGACFRTRVRNGERVRERVQCQPLSWRQRVPAVRTTIAQVRQLLSTTSLSGTCEAPVEHWGMATGHEGRRPLQRGWIPVDCGETRNAFWRVPRVRPLATGILPARIARGD